MEIGVPLSDEDRRRLAQALGGTADVDRVAALVATAGAAELLSLATGRVVPTTVADLRAHRIFCLVQEGMTLAEAEALVAAIFKVPSATAKRFVNNAVARYAVELSEGLHGALTETLEDASWDPEHNRWNVRIGSTFVRERLLDILGRLDLPDPVSAQRGPVWRFADETYQAVRMAMGLEAKPHE
jgi:hypothetical protein